MNNRATTLVLLMLLVGSRCFMIAVTGYTSDDAFITYRYAENLGSGNGFVYNVDERVQGTSSPLYTWILACVSYVFGAQWIPVASQLVSLFSDALSLVLIMRVLSSSGSGAQFLAGALFALYPKVLLISNSGMEIPVVAMLMLFSFYCFQRGRPVLAFVAFGILLLTRADAFIWVFMCMSLWVWQKKTIPPIAPLFPLVLCGVWLVISFLYFGSVIPHSIIAKRVSWQHLFGFFEPVRVLLGYFPFHALRGFPTPVTASMIVVMLAPVIVVGVHLFRRKDPLLIFPAFFIVYNMVFAFGRVIMADWYYLPGFVAYFITLGSGWDWFVDSLPSVRAKVSLDILLRYSIVPPLIFLVIVGAYRWAHDPGDWFQHEHVRIGHWLKEHAPDDASVLLEPAGYIGWESKLYIHDTVGLVSPDVLAYRQRHVGSDAWFIQYIQDRRPTYVILQDWELPRNQLFLGYGDGIFRGTSDRQWFLSHYELVEFNSRPEREDSVHFVIYHQVGPELRKGGSF